MKKLLILLAIIIACSLAACGAQNDIIPDECTQYNPPTQEQPPENTPEGCSFESAVSWAGWSDSAKIHELALNKENFPISLYKHVPIYKCDSLDELNEFKATFDGIFSMNYDYDEVPSFEEVTVKYTEEFFAENDLLLVYVEVGTTSIRYWADSVSKENGRMSVYIKDDYDPNADVNAAMGGWFVTLEVSKELTQDCTEFDAVFKK